MSSGGGGGATTTSGIAPEFKPHLTKALGQATDLTFGDPAQQAELRAKLGRGTIADDAESRAAADVQKQVANQALGGINPAAIQRQMMNTQGALQAGSQGQLGNARQQRANAAALADQAVQLQQADLQQKAMGAEGLGAAAAQKRALEQQQLDAPHTALQRYFGYLGNVGQQQTQQQGGGK